MPQLLLYALIFVSGVLVGSLLMSFLADRFTDYSGEMVITQEADKKLYSLELYETVEDLDQRTEITFKVITPAEESSRE